MTIYKNCKMVTLYHSAEVSAEWPCVVKLSPPEILVEYDYDGLCQYIGQSRGLGHYELHAPAIKGHASLHMFEGSEVMEGSWVEGAYKGMWRIELK